MKINKILISVLILFSVFGVMFLAKSYFFKEDLIKKVQLADENTGVVNNDVGTNNLKEENILQLTEEQKIIIDEDYGNKVLKENILKKYQQMMRIKSFSTEGKLKNIFLSHYFDSEMPNSSRYLQGKAIILGFKDFNEGDEAWGDFIIQQATYDFRNIEYVKFVTEEDYRGLKSGELKGQIEVGGIKGLVQTGSETSFGNFHTYKRVIFPFEKYYILVSYDLDEDSIIKEPYMNEVSSKRQKIIDGLKVNVYPEGERKNLEIFDSFIDNLEFMDSQF